MKSDRNQRENLCENCSATCSQQSPQLRLREWIDFYIILPHTFHTAQIRKVCLNQQFFLNQFQWFSWAFLRLYIDYMLVWRHFMLNCGWQACKRIPEADFATAVPDPMATPISAFFNAGASLTPSPVMADISPSLWRYSTILLLCAGSTRENNLQSKNANLLGENQIWSASDAQDKSKLFIDRKSPCV